MNQPRFWPPHDIERDGLMRVAAKTADFAMYKASIESPSVGDGCAGPLLRFEGEMVCETFHYERSPNREGNERNAMSLSSGRSK